MYHNLDGMAGNGPPFKFLGSLVVILPRRSTFGSTVYAPWFADVLQSPQLLVYYTVGPYQL